MKFNQEKCFVLKVTHSQNPKDHSYSLANTILQETNSHSYLDIEISNDLKWNKHINQIAAKWNRLLGFVKRNLHSCTKDIKNLAYRTLVRPSLEYSSAVLDQYTSELIYQLEAVQRRAVRFVKNNYDTRASVTDMLKDTNWTTLAHRRKIARLSIFHSHTRVTFPFLFEHCYTRSSASPEDLTAKPTLNDKHQRTVPNSHSYLEHKKTGTVYLESTSIIEDPKLFKQQIISLQ